MNGSRRRFLCFVGASCVVPLLSGCNANNVRLTLAFSSADQIISTVYDWIRRTFVFTVGINGVERLFSATLDDAQAAQMQKGGSLLIRTSDGTEIPVSYTLENAP